MDGTIEQLLLWGARCGDLLEALNDRVYATALRQQKRAAAAEQFSRGSGVVGGGAAATGTVCVPFDISEPRPKPPPQAELAPPAPRRPKLPPPRRAGPTREERAIEAAKAANREAARAKHAAVCPFKLRVLERPTQAAALQEEAERKLAAELATRAVARPAPAAPEAEVRLNAAAVLREDAVHRRKQAQEAEALQR